MKYNQKQQVQSYITDPGQCPAWSNVNVTCSFTCLYAIFML